MPTDAAAKPNDDLAHVNPRRWLAVAIPITRDRSRGRMAAGCGFSTAAKRTGSSRNCCSSLSHAGILKSGARATSGHARPLVRSSAERSPEDGAERKRRRADSPRGSSDRSQFDSEDVSGIPSTRSWNAFSPAAIVTESRFSSGGIGQLHPVPYAQKGL